MYEDQTCKNSCDKELNDQVEHELERYCICKDENKFFEGECILVYDYGALGTAMTVVASLTGPSMIIGADPILMWGIIMIM